MYRIIYVSFSAIEPLEHSFGMLDGDYETREEAIEAVHKYVAVDYANLIEGNEDNADLYDYYTEEFEIDGEYELDVHCNLYYTEYKVVC